MATANGPLTAVIIDRKKNLVKLKGGEYVALDRMNTVYRASPFVNVEAGGVCCFADASLDRAVALVQCKESELIKAAEEGGVIFSDVSELQANPMVGLLIRSPRAVTSRFDIRARHAFSTWRTCAHLPYTAGASRASKVARGDGQGRGSRPARAGDFPYTASAPRAMRGIDARPPRGAQVTGAYPLLDPWLTENGCLTATLKLVPKAVFKRQAKELDVVKAKGRRS